MSAWTAERLDALPEGTVVGWREVGSTAREHFVVRVEHHRYDWFEAGPVGGRYTSNSLLYYAVPSSIRVVSVPVAALLSDETQEAVSDELADLLDPHAIAENREERCEYGCRLHMVVTPHANAWTPKLLRAAVAHVTGDEACR